MWNDPPVQVHLVGFFGGVAAPCILVGEFTLNKVIAQLRYGQWERTSLQRMRDSFSVSRSNPVTAFRAEFASGYWQTVPITLLR